MRQPDKHGSNITGIVFPGSGADDARQAVVFYPRLHFGAGQTEARIELPPGKHTLQLVLGDAKHYPFNPPLISQKITITVK